MQVRWTAWRLQNATGRRAMISRYNGTCEYCKRPTKASVDHYSLEEKISFHFACRNEAPDPPAAPTPTPDAEELAERLGYVRDEKEVLE